MQSTLRPTQWDVLGLGAIAVDDLIYLDGFPLPDSKVRVRARQRDGGGLCATSLVAAARLGAACAYLGVLGDDELSHFSREELEREGIDCSFIEHHSEARPHHSNIIVDRLSGGRTILSDNSGVKEISPARITSELIARAKTLFIDHTVPHSGALAALIARTHQIPVVADIERTDSKGLPELLLLVDHLIVSLSIARQLSGKDDAADAAKCLAQSREVAVVTDGANGCWSATAGEAKVLWTPAFAVEVVDTTGCGDVFHGAYAAGLARGDDLKTRVQIASAAAAIKATQRGGRSGIPTRAALEA